MALLSGHEALASTQPWYPPDLGSSEDFSDLGDVLGEVIAEEGTKPISEAHAAAGRPRIGHNGGPPLSADIARVRGAADANTNFPVAPHSRAWGRLANAIAKDPSVSDVALVVLAYRLTLIDWDGLHWRDVKKIVRRGLGKRAFHRALRNLLAATDENPQGRGLLNRCNTRQAEGRGRGYAKDEVAPGAIATGTGYRRVERHWFDGRFSLKALALLLYARAAGALGIRPWEIARRFEWSLPTIRTAADELMKVEVIEDRGKTQAPLYAPPNCKIVHRKKVHRKTTHSKKVHHTHSVKLSHNVSPLHTEKTNTQSATRPALETSGASGTDAAENGPLAQASNDLIAATEATFEARLGMLPAKRPPMVMDREGAKVHRKTTHSKKVHHTHSVKLSHNVSPLHTEKTNTQSATRPALETSGASGTDAAENGPLAQASNDLIAATEATFEARLGMLPAKRPPMVMDREGAEVRISDKDRKSIEALGGDVEELFDRAKAQMAKGRCIGSVVRYMIQIAKNDAATRLGTELGVVQEIITGNTHGRKAALAKATGGTPKSSAAVLRDRARTTAARSDGAALMASLERLQQGRRP